MDMTVPTSAHLEAQTAVIGCLLIEPEKLCGKIFAEAHAVDFADPAWRHIFDAAAGLFSRGESVDAVTVADAAGRAYEPLIREAMELTPTVANLDVYLRILREEGRLLRMKQLAEQVGSCTDTESAGALLQEAAGLLSGQEDARVVPFYQGYAEFVGRLEKKEPPNFESFGIDKLDEMVHVRPGGYVIVGAGTSVGKTLLAAQFAMTAATRKRVGYFSFEMKDRDLFDRMGSRLARVEFRRVTGGTASPQDIQNAYGAGTAADKIHMDVINAAGFGVPQIRAEVVARRYDYIVVDYLQLVQAPGKNRAEIVTNVSIGLMSLAKGLGVTVLALSQFSRGEQQDKKSPRRPTLSDLRESGQIEQDADVVMLMSRLNEQDRQGPRWLEVAKNRQGLCGTICLAFDPRWMEFTITDSRKYMGVAAETKPRKSTAPGPAIRPPKWTPIDGQEAMPFE